MSPGVEPGNERNGLQSNVLVRIGRQSVDHTCAERRARGQDSTAAFGASTNVVEREDARVAQFRVRRRSVGIGGDKRPVLRLRADRFDRRCLQFTVGCSAPN